MIELIDAIKHTLLVTLPGLLVSPFVIWLFADHFGLNAQNAWEFAWIASFVFGVVVIPLGILAYFIEEKAHG
jgi:RsiW-degrading membrane proteinase PrsW (M82 family)